MNRIMNLALIAATGFTLNCGGPGQTVSTDVVVLLNSKSHHVKSGTQKLLPYLDHFGITYSTTDLADGLPANSGDPAVVILSHPEIDGHDRTLAKKLEQYLGKHRERGTGIVSFDPLIPSSLLSHQGDEPGMDTDVGELEFSRADHYITRYHQPGEVQDLFGFMALPVMTTEDAEVLLTGNDQPLLAISDKGTARVVQWTSMDWMYMSVLGPLGGLDDLLWKSIVWAARKPFAMQAIPPLVTMRVDDVVGSGRQQWGQSPLYWVKTVNQYGFKPWLSLFIYNLTPEAIEELKEIINGGWATASPHALGRPPRPESSQEHFDAYYEDQMVRDHFIPEYYHPRAIPYMSDYYDEFIFYDHNNRKPWSDDTAAMALKAVDDWYEAVGPLPMSKYLIPHWGEMGSNTISHVARDWNIEFIAKSKVLDKAWGDDAPSIKQGPFKRFDEPVVGRPKKVQPRFRSSYSADFIELAGEQFFAFSSAISDITGYELEPDNDVEATASRGIRTLRRGLESKSLAVLFTHETDYIFRVKPENWDAIFQKISQGIASYSPVCLTTDDALRILRAHHTSAITQSRFNTATGKLEITLSGHADVPTNVWVYTESNGEVQEKRVDIPAFEETIKVEVK
jgi:hypothetical protein